MQSDCQILGCGFREVTLGGVNVKDYSMNSLMRNFSFVFQSSVFVRRYH